MFCSKCGRNIKTNVCEYCEISDKVYHDNNYLKSSEMYELLSDDEDFSYIREDKISEIQEEVQVFKTPNEKIIEQDTGNTSKKQLKITVNK